jgi:ribosomal protein S18 acetylase RimI-like enzyme
MEISIRELNPDSESEILLVAQRMRETLIEVLGEEKGTAFYTMEWLVDRVRWHLDSSQTAAKIFLIEGYQQQIIGHAIARIETDSEGSSFGYFSTIFIEGNSRKQGLAQALIETVEAWLMSMKMPKIVYNTAKNHFALIRLFERNGFKIAHEESEMVQLVKKFN